MTERYGLIVRAFLRDHGSEGDADNYAKLIQDALEGIAWANDRQVDALLVVKLFGRGDPRTEVEVCRLGPGASYDLASATLGIR